MITKESIFHYNPFSGVSSCDIKHIIVPIFEIEELLKLINNEKPFLIEFLGKKGRGKTTHLKWLKEHLNHYPFYELKSKIDKQKLFQDSSEVIFIDSIHHLNIKERLQLFKSKKTIVFTTHWTKKLECLFVGKKLKTIKFQGINTLILREIVLKRFQFALQENQNLKEEISELELKKWIDTNGDNYRKIINGLFDKYQKQ